MKGAMKRWSAAAAAAVVAASVPLFALQDKPPEKQEAKKETRTAYIRRVFEKDRCGFGDACRMIASLAKDAHTDAPFADLHKELAASGVVDADWAYEESTPVTKGTLAYMLCKTLKIRGGVTTTIFGMSRRYAFRECVYLGLLAGRADMEYVTGREMIDAVADAGVYKERGAQELRK